MHRISKALPAWWNLDLQLSLVNFLFFLQNPPETLSISVLCSELWLVSFLSLPIAESFQER